MDSLDPGKTGVADPGPHQHSESAYLQYTSGSTRTPNGVLVSHENVVVNVRQAIHDYLGESGNEPSLRVVSRLPFYHDMGLILGILAPIVAGAVQS